jgi:signal transduction histidine kinase
VCRSCHDRPCAVLHSLELPAAPDFATCYRGVGMVHLGIGSVSVVVNGLFFPAQTNLLPRKTKKTIDANRTTEDSVIKWGIDANVTFAVLEEQMRMRLDQSLASLHDVQTSVSTILRNAEEFLNAQPGDDHDDKLDRLPHPARRLLTAIEVLQGRMNLLPLLANPDAARYGRRHPMPIYKVVDRIVRILRPVAEKENLSLSLSGTSFNQPVVYDSFDSIPLILLDNAIKYSLPDQTICVDVNDVPGGVRVEIRSFSPVIPPDEQQRIFERGFRGRFASATTSRGSGLGLHLAGLVAKANGLDVRFSSSDDITLVGDVPYCENTFLFTVR